jgi:ankyrin repeat protein
MWAASAGHADIVEILVNSKADLNIQDEVGEWQTLSL